MVIVQHGPIPPPRTEWQTPVKTLPSPVLRTWSGKKGLKFIYISSCVVKIIPGTSMNVAKSISGMAMMHKKDDFPVLTPVLWLRVVLRPLWKCNPWCPILLWVLCLLWPPYPLRPILSKTFQNLFRFSLLQWNGSKLGLIQTWDISLSAGRSINSYLFVFFWLFFGHKILILVFCS